MLADFFSILLESLHPMMVLGEVIVPGWMDST
jgi:hypothetical protein